MSIKIWEGDRYDWDIWQASDNFHPQWTLFFKDTTAKEMFVEKMRKGLGGSLSADYAHLCIYFS